MNRPNADTPFSQPVRAVLATRNQGKIAELADTLKQFGIILSGLEDYPEIGDVPETGATFTENALLKARAICQATGQIAIADDSGLVVNALQGAPGVYSARYGDDWDFLPNESRDGRNIRKLLHAMGNVPPNERQAHFETAMAAAAPNGKEITAKGRWDGIILESPRGENGFGYDPVFFDPRLQKSAAQLTRAEKNAVSHRGQALASLLRIWPQFMKETAVFRNI